MSSTPVFVVENRHTEACGPPPEWVGAARAAGESRFYFENQLGEQWIASTSADLFRFCGGDLGWQTVSMPQPSYDELFAAITQYDEQRGFLGVVLSVEEILWMIAVVASAAAPNWTAARALENDRRKNGRSRSGTASADTRPAKRAPRSRRKGGSTAHGTDGLARGAEGGPRYQVKVRLLRIKPPIWRRLIVPAEITLAALHEVVQIAMGWDDSHLHEFTIGGNRYGASGLDGYSESVLDEQRHTLGAVTKPRDRFRYMYDFGDSWEHEIVVEKMLPSSTGIVAPACTGGGGACPPEDCGGAWGYGELLEVLADESHPDHEERMEWAGGPFDPAAFDADTVTSKLARLAKR